MNTGPTRHIKRQSNSAPAGPIVLGAVLVILLHAFAWGQSSSLYEEELPVPRQVYSKLGQSSWTYRELPTPHKIALRDLVTIRVDVASQTFSEGEFESRKRANFDAVLSDWLQFMGGLKALKPAAQADGDPRIAGSINSQFRAEGGVETRESVKFDITARIVDIQPNGNIVLEAHQQVQNNDLFWDYSLSGTCRRQDIDPSNVVLSKHIANLRIKKEERGAVRDSYRRGWVLRLRDMFRWF